VLAESFIEIITAASAQQLGLEASFSIDCNPLLPCPCISTMAHPMHLSEGSTDFIPCSLVGILSSFNCKPKAMGVGELF
jgi:hypothetical protein